MKIVFVGPTLPDVHRLAGTAITLQPPALQGDILSATERGATAIGLVDGHFEQVAPVWHKEILYALTQGVQVFGAASMGALRAAECAPFGMTGIGEIYRQYAEGERMDDADVALIHGPAELGYLPLTLPLVNVDMTLRGLRDRHLLSAETVSAIGAAATAIFYKERTWAAVVERALLPASFDRVRLADLLVAEFVDQKRIDALLLFDALHNAPDQRKVVARGWKFNSTSMWKRLSGQPDASS